jgi:ribosome-associated translation inhibitor RaiA
MVQKMIEQKQEVLKKEVKKVEVPKVEGQNEPSYVTDSFIETFWDQFEGAVSRTRDYSEQRQELYLQAIKETTKFNGIYLKTLKGLFEQTTKLNGELRKGLFQNNIFNTNESTHEVTESLKSHVIEGASKLEELYLTPINSGFDLIERTEKLFEQNSEAFLEYTNEALNAWEAVTDNYLKQARKTHQNIAHRLEDSLRVLVAPSK